MDIAKGIRDNFKAIKNNITKNVIIKSIADWERESKAEAKVEARKMNQRRNEGIPAKDRMKVSKGTKCKPKTKAQLKMDKVLKEFENKTLKDKSGKFITDYDQALAIAMSESESE